MRASAGTWLVIQFSARSSRGRASSSEVSGFSGSSSLRMRSVCSSCPAVMSTTEASVRYGSGRGVLGSSPAAVPMARAYAAASAYSTEPSATLRASESHSS